MRKVMILASMLAMVMLAASPALAQTQSSEQNASGNNINQLSQQCQNIIGDINVEGGDNNAAISDDDTNVGVGGEGGDAAAGNIQYNAGEAQYGGDQEANSAGGDGGDVALSDDDANVIAQENNTTVNVVQNCFQAAVQANVNIEDVEAPQAPAPNGDNGDDQYEAPAPDDDQYVAPEGDDDAAAGAAAPAGDDDAAVGAGAAAPADADDAEGGAVAVLPDTGGASLFTLGAGALLVAGGLLARRIIR